MPLCHPARAGFLQLILQACWQGNEGQRASDFLAVKKAPFRASPFQGNLFYSTKVKDSIFYKHCFHSKIRGSQDLLLSSPYFNHFISFSLKQSFQYKIGRVYWCHTELLQQAHGFVVLRNLLLFPVNISVSGAVMYGCWRYLPWHREADILRFYLLKNGCSYHTAKPLTCKKYILTSIFSLEL